MLDIYINKRKLLQESYNDLFVTESFALENEIDTQQNFSLEEICRQEYEAFGYMVTRHPLHFYKNFINDKSITKAVQMPQRKGKYVKMIGWYMTSKRIKTRSGEIMKFLSLEDLTGTFEAVIFPKVYMQYAELTSSMGPYVVEGIIDENDHTNLIVKKLSILSSQMVKSEMMKDGVENTYFGDVEKISEDEFRIAEVIDQERLRIAYLS